MQKEQADQEIRMLERKEGDRTPLEEKELRWRILGEEILIEKAKTKFENAKANMENLRDPNHVKLQSLIQHLPEELQELDETMGTLE